MLARYTIVRGKRKPKHGPYPASGRQDTRYKCGKHCLHPERDMVKEYLANPTEKAWAIFQRKYLALLEKEFKKDRSKFDELAELATKSDVYIGCNCPTETNPNMHHCHTYLALKFMKKKYPRLKVELPPKYYASTK